MSTLHADSITKTFQDKRILQDIFVGCSTGEVVGLLGRNGSGKSTLLKIIAGLETAETRFVRIDDVILKNVSQNHGLISFLPQHHFLPGHVKIRNSIEVFTNRENAEKLSQHPFITPFLDSRPKTLSGGELKLIEILLILYSESKFILLDEPFQSLAPKMTAEIKRLITTECKDKGVIISDHQYEHVMEISDRIYLLKDAATVTIAGIGDLQVHKYIS